MRTLNTSKKILLLLVLSTISYSIAGVLGYKGVVAMPLYSFMLVYAIGVSIGTILMAFALKMRFRIPPRNYLVGIVAALLIVVLIYTLYSSYKHYDLAGIYPFTALAVMVFLAIDIIVYNKRLPKGAEVFLVAGVLLIIMGSFVTGSKNLSFQVGLLPIIAILAFTGGIADYLFFYKTNKYSLGSKMASYAAVLLILAIAFSISHFGSNSYPVSGTVYALLAGISGIIGIALDVHAMEVYTGKGIAKSVTERNFINDFPYMDTVIVLIGSVLIGSFTYQQIAGGFVITLGVYVLDRAKKAGGGNVQHRRNIQPEKRVRSPKGL